MSAIVSPITIADVSFVWTGFCCLIKLDQILGLKLVTARVNHRGLKRNGRQELDLQSVPLPVVTSQFLDEPWRGHHCP